MASMGAGTSMAEKQCMERASASDQRRTRHDHNGAAQHCSKCGAGGGNITVLAGKWHESMSMSVSEAIGLTYSCTARVLQGQGANLHNNAKNEVQTGIALQDSSLAAREETAQACTVNTPRRFLRALQIA